MSPLPAPTAPTALLWLLQSLATVAVVTSLSEFWRLLQAQLHREGRSWPHVSCPGRPSVPDAQVAFGADGGPSKALEGFCRKNGVAAGDVTREADGKGTEYVWVTVQSKGCPAAEVRRRSVLRMPHRAAGTRLR